MRKPGIADIRLRPLRAAAGLALVATLSACYAIPRLETRSAASDSPEMPRSSYDEFHRPAFHYSPPGGWMNDPNGLVHHDGEWHLFYQYHPYDTVWGPMHWAHAVSRDLVNWKTLPIAIAPDKNGYIFSGSAVIDTQNTAGFGDNAMVATYTIHDPERARTGTRDHESQGIAISFDKGRTFQKYTGNPVLPNPGQTRDFRDPNVFWDDEQERWVVALSVTNHIRFYSSPDLKEWAFLSSFGDDVGAQGGVWECPNLFPIRDEVSGETRWVLIVSLNPGGPQGGSGTQYFVGDWDGGRFTLDPAFGTEGVWLDHGADNYAGITWNNAPDGRRVFIGWMSNWLYARDLPTGVWRSAMTIPREMNLHGLELRQSPASEIENLRGTPDTLAKSSDGKSIVRAVSPNAEYHLTFRLPEVGDHFTIAFSNNEEEELALGIDPNGYWFVDRTKAGDANFSQAFSAVHRASRKHENELTNVRLLVDSTSVEIFVDSGATVLTELFFPTTPLSSMSLKISEGGSLVSGQVWPLRQARFGHSP